MSAQQDLIPRHRRMLAEDLDAIAAIEGAIYPHPWTRGNFADSLAAGYHCWVVECGGAMAGYTVVMIAAGEAHLLNLSVAAPWQRRGIGREALGFVSKLARDYGAQKILLEVRPSNTAAIALYASAGFAEIAVRRDYYPAGNVSWIESPTLRVLRRAVLFPTTWKIKSIIPVAGSVPPMVKGILSPVSLTFNTTNCPGFAFRAMRGASTLKWHTVFSPFPFYK